MNLKKRRVYIFHLSSSHQAKDGGIEKGAPFYFIDEKVKAKGPCWLQAKQDRKLE